MTFLSLSLSSSLTHSLSLLVVLQMTYTTLFGLYVCMVRLSSGMQIESLHCPYSFPLMTIVL